MKPEIRVRLTLMDILDAVLEQGRSLTVVLPEYLNQFTDKRDQALIQFCAYGIFRGFFRLDFFIKKLASRPIKDKKIYYLLLIGFFQISVSRIPDFAVVNTLVETVKKIKLFSAASFVNALLREYLRQKDNLQEEVEKSPSAYYAHPTWLINSLKTAWPDNWKNICIANNQLPPMWLRINPLQVNPKTYLELLEKNDIAIAAHHGAACCLQTPVDVSMLPQFNQGWVSVQDGAAQFAAELLDLKPDQTILDACAAPGGKTVHILEKEPKLAKLIAIDKDAARTMRIQENLQRLRLTAEVRVADATFPESWWDKQLFDRILLDAPCSATGVIRRHPDIKLLRQAKDITVLAKQQLTLLNVLWPLLKPQGKLLYATCSILPQENTQIIEAFCRTHTNAHCLPLNLPAGRQTTHGWQILPGENNQDGFFYALLQKE